MIKLEHISYKYNNSLALNDISFQIARGEKVVLMGVNGSGKSTVLKLLDGLIFPQKGEYYFNNEQITEKKLKNREFNRFFRSKIVMLFQKPDVMLFNPTVFDEIAYGLKQLGVQDVEQKVIECAKKFKIEHLLDKLPYQLSCGEKKKVALASLLIIDPEVILLDEPFSYLDPVALEWMVDFLTNLDKTMIISLHNFRIATLLAKRILVLSADHKLVYDGEVYRFFNDKNLLKKAGMLTQLNI